MSADALEQAKRLVRNALAETGLAGEIAGSSQEGRSVRITLYSISEDDGLQLSDFIQRSHEVLRAEVPEDAIGAEEEVFEVEIVV